MKRHHLYKMLLPIFLSSWILGVEASTIAIIDSGTDISHRDLKDYIWRNRQEIRGNGQDDDQNGYIDDVFGWNFADQNSQVIDEKYRNYFAPEIYRFFDIQAHMTQGNVSTEDVSWLREKLKNPLFSKDVSMFGNFMHGTHVAGIALGKVKNAKILSLKIIPTEVSGPDGEDDQGAPEQDPQLVELSRGKTLEERKSLLAEVIEQVANAQAKEMHRVAEYVSQQGVDVANGSFGTSFEQIEAIVKVFYFSIFDRKPLPRELAEYTKYFMKRILMEEKKSFDLASNTVFVFAAGNDASNNDLMPASPANVDSTNVISVAATQGRDRWAKFSNYGKTQVDVAAPGVNIYSTIPGDKYIKVSGTSQATPYVTHVVSEMNSVNSSLSPVELKKILMMTVDYKDFLKDKVASKGIVNQERAVKAAFLAQSSSIDEAIRMARAEVQDEKMSDLDGEKSRLDGRESEIPYVLPLPSMIQWRGKRP